MYHFELALMSKEMNDSSPCEEFDPNSSFCTEELDIFPNITQF